MNDNIARGLAEAWSALSRRNRGLGNVTVVVVDRASDAGGDHTSDGSIVHVDEATLRLGGARVFETLAHQAVHVLAARCGVADITGRYHSLRFVNLAVEFGLEVGSVRDSKRGYDQAHLSKTMMGLYSKPIARLDDLLKEHLPAEAKDSFDADARPRGSSRRDQIKLSCGCPIPRSFRMAESVWTKGPIMCGLCRQPFMPAS